MVQAAISRGFRVYSLTEHMPRDKEDFYPEEVCTSAMLTRSIAPSNLVFQQEKFYSEEGLVQLMDDFYPEAVRLREKYASQIQILIGFESEWIRPSSLKLIQTLLGKHTFDFFVGSVHHVHTISIDFDRPKYEDARLKAGGTDERLFEDYFDSQYSMLQAIQPPVVGHFDLIRLLSDEREKGFKRWGGVWKRIQRNLEYVVSYGGVLELNSSALRKGMSEPYPCLEICEVCYAFHISISTLKADSYLSGIPSHRRLFRFVRRQSFCGPGWHELSPVTGIYSESRDTRYLFRRAWPPRSGSAIFEF
jgi:histidinol-phosphatase (PHP family)